MSIKSGKFELSNKTKLLNSLIDEITYKKKKFEIKMNKYKKIDEISESIIMGSGSIAVSSLIVSLASINPIALIIGTVFSSISTIGGAVKRTVNFREKYETCRTSYNQYSDLLREVKTTLVKNHLDSYDKEQLIDEINIRISLIEDSQLPI